MTAEANRSRGRPARGILGASVTHIANPSRLTMHRADRWAVLTAR
jgi:hypothetical protein